MVSERGELKDCESEERMDGVRWKEGMHNVRLKE
jgi:hypothetical protein